MTMKIKLQPKVEKYVRTRVGERRYASVDDMVTRALTLLEATERAFGPKEELQKAIDIGLADIRAGRESDWDLEEMKKRVRQRAKRAS
jgi:putative addiction module CopG family antidote